MALIDLTEDRLSRVHRESAARSPVDQDLIGENGATDNVSFMAKPEEGDHAGKSKLAF
jgi:hypothetical protein